MTLDEYITRHCAEYAAALEKLASASVENKVIHDMNGLVKHLRSLYRVRRSAFPTYLLEKIKKFSTPGSNPIIKEPLEEKVKGPSKEFEVGKYYLSQHGVFRVTGFGQFPSIDPPLYPKCKTLYFKSYMLEEHNKWLEERTRAQKSTNAYARNFRLPKVTAEEEIAELKEQYHLMIEGKHREFLLKHRRPYLGTQPTTKGFRITNCHACKTVLTNELYKECQACGWIICPCGACGCAYG